MTLTFKVEDFASEDFDAKEWINQNISKLQSQTEGGLTVEKWITESIMNVQMLSSETGSAFDETCTSALNRMPRAVLEVGHMAKSARELRGSFNSLLAGELSEAEAQTQQSIERMNQLHNVKLKLDVCRRTINEVVYLSEAVRKMNTSDSNQSSSELGSEIGKMQTALRSLEGFPEHHQIFKADIEKFEKKLMDMVEKDCLNALVERKVSVAQDHLKTMESIGKLESIVGAFIKESITPVLDSWSGFDPSADFATWLPGFHTDLQNFVQHQRAYYVEVFQARAPHYLVRLIQTIMASLSPPFKTRLHQLNLEGIVRAYQTTKHLSRVFCDDPTFFGGGGPGEAEERCQQVRRAIFRPFQQEQEKYPQREKENLTDLARHFKWIERYYKYVNAQASIRDSAASPTAGGAPTPTRAETLSLTKNMLSSMRETRGKLFEGMEAAVLRCIEFTEGVEIPGLYNALADVLKYVCEHMATILKLDKEHNQVPANQDEFDKANQERRSVLLRFHTLCCSLKSDTEQFETQTRKRMLDLKARLLGGRDIPQVWMLRDDSASSKKGTLSFFFDKLERSPSQMPMIEALTAFKALEKEAESAVLDKVFEPVKGNLTNWQAQDVWTSLPDEFSQSCDFPSEQIIRIGDYLYGLPGMVQPSEDDDAFESVGGHDATLWTKTVAGLTAREFIETAKSLVPKLSETGKLQLKLDADTIQQNLKEAQTDEGQGELEELKKSLSVAA